MKMKRIIILSLCILMALSTLVACDNKKEPGKTEEPAGTTQAGGDAVETTKAPSAGLVKYSIGVGNPGGMFYVMGAGWANILNDVFDGRFLFTAEQTGGGPANVALLESGEIQFGHSGTSAVGDAFNGTAPWSEGETFTKLRAIFPMFTMSVTPFTLKENGITSLKDLHGKKVGLGSKGSGVDSVVRKIFESLDIVPSSIYNDTWAATVSALQDGMIDAVITQQVAPWPSLSELEASKEVVLIEMTEEELDMIKELFPFYSDAVIPKGAYKANADKDVRTVWEWAFMTASVDVADQDVYDVLEATFAAYDDLLIVHPGLDGVLAENASNIPVVWHPGAVRYFEDHGIQLQEPNPLFVPKGN